MRYIPGATGRAVELPALRDLQEKFPRAWLAFQPDPLRKDPVEAERPYLVLEGRGKGPSFVSARCRRDGVPVTVEGSQVLKAWGSSGGFGQGAWHQAIALPWRLKYSGGLESEMDGGPAGKWQCLFSFDGKPGMEVGFEITQEGICRPHQSQQGRSGDRASPWWLLETRLSGE